MIRAVIDTNVLLQGLTLKGESGRIIELWGLGRFIPCVSTALALEYEEVLLRRFPPARHEDVRDALQALFEWADYVPINFNLRPSSPDPDDDFVLECAFNAGACLVSANERDLREPAKTFKVEFLLPPEFLARLDQQE